MVVSRNSPGEQADTQVRVEELAARGLLQEDSQFWVRGSP